MPHLGLRTTAERATIRLNGWKAVRESDLPAFPNRSDEIRGRFYRTVTIACEIPRVQSVVEAIGEPLE